MSVRSAFCAIAQYIFLGLIYGLVDGKESALGKFRRQVPSTSSFLFPTALFRLFRFTIPALLSRLEEISDHTLARRSRRSALGSILSTFCYYNY